jgi:transcriptional regulator with GAF, ATPase, and Fis domain
MENSPVSFEQILNATVRMLRSTWKTSVCVFLQVDDHGNLRVRAADGIPAKTAASLSILSTENPFAECFSKNQIVELVNSPSCAVLKKLYKPDLKKGEKFVLAPVSGESRVLGLLFLGPFPRQAKIHPREAELRSAGALCAVLSAHWRLYDWMSDFMPQLNHQLRTPLTAVQGSIGMVLGGLFGQVGPDVKQMLEMAQKGCERTVRTIEEYINKQSPPKE